MARIARYFAYALVGLAGLAIALALVLPLLLDTPRMRAAIQEKLSQAVQREVRWEKFSLRILPSPRGSLRGLTVQGPLGSVTAEEVTVALRFWPLLRGRPEITSVRLVRPALRIAGPRRAKEEVPPEQARTGALVAYRSAITALVRGLRQFVPNTRFSIEDAQVSLHVEGVPPIDLSAINISAVTRADALELEASAASPYWAAMKLSGRVAYSDLVSTAALDLHEIKAQPWLDWALGSSSIAVALPAVDLKARFRGDAAKALELEVDAAAPSVAVAHGKQRIAVDNIALKGTLAADENEVTLRIANAALGPSGLSDAVLRYSPKGRSLAADSAYRVDLAQALGYTRRLATPAMTKTMARIESASGTLRGRVKVALGGADRQFTITVEKSDAALEVNGVPGALRLHGAIVEIDPHTARVESAALTIPTGELFLSTLRYSTDDGSAAAKGDFDLDLGRSFDVVKGLMPEEKRKPLAVVESVKGRARGSADVSYSRKGWRIAVKVTASDSEVGLRGLPGPAGLRGVSVVATPKVVTIDRARVTFLDSSASASAKISNLAKAPRVEGSVGEALVGAKLLDWVWQSAKIAPAFEPKAPIRLAVPRFAFAPKKALQMQASARFASGPAVAAELGWAPEALELRRVTIKDGYSDVSVSLRSQGGELDGRYTGKLDGRSIAALLKAGKQRAGAMSGDLRFRFNRAEPRRTTAQGSLVAENLDLSWLAGKPARIERLELSADADSVRIAQASAVWAGQRATLTGSARRSAEGPVIDAAIDSPGVVVDAFLPEKKKSAAPAKPAEAKAPEQPAEKPGQKKAEPPNIWPLPVTGKIVFHSAFVQSGHLKVEPVAATLVLERDKAHVALTEGQLCGLALPFTLEATPKGFAAAARISAKKLPFEQTAKCLSGDKVLLTGTLNLDAQMRTEGRLDELAKNLNGTVNADLRDGLVMKFALIGNILSMRNIVALAQQGGPMLGAAGFPFRQLSAQGRLEKGTFVLDEGIFYSNAVGLGANGWVSLANYQTRMTVLVAPLALLNEAVRKLPLLGYVVGGTFTSLPVSVSGDIRDPLVVPLGPSAITSELTGLLGRALSVPSRVAPPSAPPAPRR